MYAQSLLFFKWDIRPRIRHDGDLSRLVHQAVLTFHVIGLLLMKLTELLTGQVHLTRIVDMDVHPHASVATCYDQGTAIQFFQLLHDLGTVKGRSLL